MLVDGTVEERGVARAREAICVAEGGAEEKLPSAKRWIAHPPSALQCSAQRDRVHLWLTPRFFFLQLGCGHAFNV